VRQKRIQSSFRLSGTVAGFAQRIRIGFVVAVDPPDRVGAHGPHRTPRQSNPRCPAHIGQSKYMFALNKVNVEISVTLTLIFESWNYDLLVIRCMYMAADLFDFAEFFDLHFTLSHSEWN
jgi:hypothetical protein